MVTVKMKKNRSITQFVRRAKTREELTDIVDSWVGRWETEQHSITDRLGKAVSDDDFDAQSIAVGELRTVTEKKVWGAKKLHT